jgi:uncharacterized phosphosugar-binding protein
VPAIKSRTGSKSSKTKIPTATAYLHALAGMLATLTEGQEAAFSAAAKAIAGCIKRDGLVYLFGTGHSHLLAEEGHYRAGGLACVVPILPTLVMLHEGAVASTRLERTAGLAATALSRYPITRRDVLIVFSTSGVNAMPVEAAQLGRQLGATVIAVTSQAYSQAAAHGRTRLADVASIVIDSRVPPGDAIFGLGPRGRKAGPASTAIGAAILNAMFLEAEARVLASGGDVPVYVSANMPGAARRNAALVARYRRRNPHL